MMEPDLFDNPSPEPNRFSVIAQIEALGEFCRRHGASLLPFARRRLRDARIPEAEYSDEDLLQSGFGSLIDDIIRGKIASIEGVDGFLKILRRTMADKAMAKRDQMDALKRGGAGIQRRYGKGLDSDPPNHRPPPRERLQVADDLNLYHVGLSRNEVYEVYNDTLFELLKLLDDKNRTVALMKLRGNTITEIANQVGVSTRTIDRRLEAIRAIGSDSGMLDRD
jgi:DNA-directed RNA polymerase specialized sigma24 family protein